jgi:hypothetical protein
VENFSGRNSLRKNISQAMAERFLLDLSASYGCAVEIFNLAFRMLFAYAASQTRGGMHPMKVSKIAGFALAAALIALPAWAAQSQSSQSQSSQSQSQAMSQSVSGTIVSVTDSALTLNTGSSSTDTTQQSSSSAASEVRFVIDSNTKIDGTPTAGAKATVEYTTDSNNRKVATHVTIQSGK